MNTSSDSKTIPLPFKVMADPVNAGKHPFHDSRWIATADAQVEMSPHVPNDWSLERGSLIAQVRDGHPDIAAFIVKACNGHADLVTALRACISELRFGANNSAIDKAEYALQTHA